MNIKLIFFVWYLESKQNSYQIIIILNKRKLYKHCNDNNGRLFIFRNLVLS